MESPQITVILPVYNAARTLPDAIASIRAQEVPSQIVIVDDGSTDATPEVIASIDGVIAVRQPNQGPAAARNRGLDFVTGSLVTFIDADDVWSPGRLRHQLDLLEANPQAGIALGHTAFSALDPVSEQWISVAEPRLMYHLGAALIRSEVFDRHGRFDATLRASEDVDWFLRARDAGVGIVVDRGVVQTHRRNGENMTRGKDLRDLQFIEVLKRSMDRRRSGDSR